MPYKDIRKQRKYMRELMRRKRKENKELKNKELEDEPLAESD